MSGIDLHRQKHIFGSIFVLANKFQAVIDREFAVFDITTKQWLLTAVIEEFFDAPPTIKEVSHLMGSSHQNVKQIALKLEKKGFLELNKDKDDRRATRLRLTDKNYEFWKEHQVNSTAFLQELFKDCDEEELNGMYKGVLKLAMKLEEFE